MWQVVIWVIYWLNWV